MLVSVMFAHTKEITQVTAGNRQCYQTKPFKGNLLHHLTATVSTPINYLRTYLLPIQVTHNFRFTYQVLTCTDNSLARICNLYLTNNVKSNKIKQVYYKKIGSTLQVYVADGTARKKTLQVRGLHDGSLRDSGPHGKTRRDHWSTTSRLNIKAIYRAIYMLFILNTQPLLHNICANGFILAFRQSTMGLSSKKLQVELVPYFNPPY